MKDSLNLTELGVSPRANFSCFAIRHTRVSPDLTDPVMIEPGLIALFQTPFKVDKLWTESLGAFHDQKLAESRLLLMAFSEEMSQPELDRRVSALWYGLLVQGRAHSVDGLKLSGHNTDNGLHISSGGSLDDFYLSPMVVDDSVDADSLRLAAEIAEGIRTIFQSNDDRHYLRLRKGFNALLRGIKEGSDADFRLHQFIRSVEAVVNPDTGRTTSQFVHRGQLFAGRSAVDRALLKELFEMRSASEHLNSLKDLLDQPNPHDREKLIAVRVFQSEILAGSIYRHLLTDADLLQFFSDDDGISTLWGKRDDELIKKWGPPLDLERSVEWKFDLYLSRCSAG